MKKHSPLVVIGAGPAGMAAACTARKYGVEVTVVDEQAQPGGQIYRNVVDGPLSDAGLLGKDYEFGKQLVQAYGEASIDHHAGASVWFLDRTRTIGVLKNGISHRLKADRIVIAVGAQERPAPIPGWELPGVMTAGAGQILLKSAGLVPEAGVILAGSGPLLLLLAWQYLRAGVSIGALLDTSDKSNQRAARRHLPGALAAGDYILKGLRLKMSIRRAHIPFFNHVSELRASGDDRLRQVAFISAGKRHNIATQLLLMHQGVIPNLPLPQAAECEIQWNEAQQCWTPRVDAWGRSSRTGVLVVGDGAGIEGARAAELSGRLAGLQVAHELGCIDQSLRDRLAAPIVKARKRHRAIRPLLDALYRVPEPYLNPHDETMVCRCEEVHAGQIREAVRRGCTGPNQVKAFTRCGMGPCQGRLCENTVAQIIARERVESVADSGGYRVRPPLKPVTLGQVSTTE